MSRSNLSRVLTDPSVRCFSPFFVLGDPDAERSLAVCRAALRAGAPMLELGLPFSDPAADGPAVLLACGRAWARGVSTAEAFELLATLRAETAVPFNLLVYGNLVHAAGIDGFVRRAVAAGASSLLVPDAGLEESEPLADACAANDLGLVQLCGPRTSDERIERLAAATTAFVYLVGQQGSTGARAELAQSAEANVRRVVAQCGDEVPVAVGFGLSRPAHLDAVFAAGARIGIVGSALIDTMTRHIDDDPSTLAAAIEQQVRELMAASNRPESTN